MKRRDFLKGTCLAAAVPFTVFDKITKTDLGNHVFVYLHTTNGSTLPMNIVDFSIEKSTITVVSKHSFEKSFTINKMEMICDSIRLFRDTSPIIVNKNDSLTITWKIISDDSFKTLNDTCIYYNGKRIRKAKS